MQKGLTLLCVEGVERELTPVQQRLLQMLEEVVGLCQEAGITYYAAGGTALGAIRHKGFIPWDDDIDLMMPRADWIRFVELAKEGRLPANRTLCCLELDESYPHVFGRYIDTTSCCVHYNQFLGGTPEGLVIDIFILDPVPDANESFTAYREALSLYNDLANELGYSYPMSSDPQLLLKKSVQMKREGRWAVLSELEREVACHDDGEFLVMRWACAPRLFHKSIFGFERLEPFEHLMISVPARLNDYLVQHYGDDWAWLPPASGRVVHDAFTFTDIDYKTFQQDYLGFIDNERARKALLARRNYHVRNMKTLHDAENLKAQILATFAREETLRRARQFERKKRPGCPGAQSQDTKIDDVMPNNLGSSATGAGKAPNVAEENTSPEASVLGDPNSVWPALEAALAAGNHAQLDAVFEQFYSIQNMPELRGREDYLFIRRFYHPVLVDLDDELLRIALINLAETNRLALASFILRAYVLVHGSLSPSLQAVCDQVLALRMPPSLADMGLVGEACDFADYLVGRMPNNFWAAFQVLDIAGRAPEGIIGDGVGMQSGPCGDVESDAHAEVLAAALKAFPESGEFSKFAADQTYEQAATPGQKQQVYKAYAKALVATTNAFLQDDVAKRFAYDKQQHDIDPDGALQDTLQQAQAAAHQMVPGKPNNNPDVTRKAVRLLFELVQLCEELGIACCLGPSSCATALLQSGPEPTSMQMPELDLIVEAGQLGAVAQALLAQDRVDRAIDCWLTNPHYPAFRLDYVDARTTFLQLEEGTDIGAPGIHVSVVAANPTSSGGVQKAIDVLDLGWSLNGYKLTKSINAKNAIAASAARAGMIAGRKRAAAALFKLNDKPSSSVGQVELNLPGGKVRCPSSVLQVGRRLTLCGVDCPAPADVTALLEATYGRSWKAGFEASLKRFDKALVSSILPYGDLFTILKAQGADPTKLYKTMRKIRFGMLPLANDLRVRSRAMLVAQRSYDRKIWFDYLESHRETIQERESHEDWPALAELFGGYRTDAMKYLKRGLCLCPSKEYLDLLCKILRHEGEADVAEKLAELAPKSHYDPIR